MSKVSIIIPAYNAERYIENCIDSLINQTYENIEIIIINDGSTDNTRTIINEYAKKNEIIHVKHINNSGVSVARNLGLDIASGEWITFVDSDDWVEPNMIQFSVNKAIETKADIIIWSYFKNFLEREIPLSLLPGGDQILVEDKDLLLLKSIYSMYGEEKIQESVSSGTVWCKLYKKSLIEENQLRFKAGLTRAQDTIFSINAFELAEKIAYYDKNLYHYRITNSSTCSGTRFIPDSESPFNLLLQEFNQFIKKYNKGNEYRKALNARSIQVLMWHLKHNYFHPSNSKGLLKKRKEINSLINSEPYKTAVKKTDYKLLPKKEKVMAKLFRKNFILVFNLIYIFHDKLQRFSDNKYA